MSDGRVWLLIGAALAGAALAVFWYLQFVRVRQAHRALTEKAARLEQTVALREQELAEGNEALQREVEERRQREEALRIADTVFEHAAEGILVTNADNNIVRVNPAFTAITGYTPGEVIGRNPSLLKSGRHDGAFYEQMWSALETRKHWQGEIWNRYKNGEIHVEWLSIVKIDGGQEPVHYLGIFHDITRRKADEELLRFKAQHDPLTELPNRELFMDRLRSAISQARRYHRNFALLQIDLDHFKEVNDTLGHGAGDQLLVEAARRLVSCVRETDTVSRWGGDEFAIVLTETANAEEAEQIARRAVSLLGEPYYLDAGTVCISGCVGIALYPRDGREADQLLRNADLALYAAKEGGRNQYRLFASAERPEDAQANLL